jgi:exopolysaccharide biosynthesis protein
LGHLRILFLAVVVIAAVCSFTLVKQKPSAAAQHLYVVRIPRCAGVVLRPVIAHGKACRSESFGEMIDRLKPYAAINGTFYDPKMRPLGDIVIDGRLANRGHYPNAVAMKKTGEIVFVNRSDRRFDRSGYQSALAAGPRLVHKGQVKLDLRADGFSKNGLKIRAQRSGIGITRKGELLLVVDTDWVTLSEFARTMLDQGAVEAMNLDGGPASGLYHNGNTLVSPMLRMTNVLTVIKKRR